MSFGKKIGLTIISLSPLVTLAADGYLEGVAGSIKKVVALLLPAFVGLVIIGFAYGLFVYLKSGAEDKEKGKNIMFWGGFAVVIMISLYGLAGLFQKITGATDKTVSIPTTYKGGGGTNTPAPTYDPAAPGPDPFAIPEFPTDTDD